MQVLTEKQRNLYLKALVPHMELKNIYSDKDNKFVDTMLETYSTNCKYSHSSKRQLAIAVLRYQNATGMSMTDLLNEAYADEDNRVRLPMRKINMRLAAMQKYIENLADVTRKNTFNIIVHFYKMHDIQIPTSIKTNVKASALKENRYIPKPDDIRAMLEVTSKLRDKAIILLQVSTGMGSSELMSITCNEFKAGVDRTTMITTLRPQRAKTKNHYITFCSPEATEAVLKYLETYKGEYLFDLNEQKLMGIYRRISQRLEEKEKGVYCKHRSHNMRKAFNSRMLNHGMPRDLVWFFSGRSENDVQRAYIDYDEAHLKAEYMKHMEAVMVLTEVIRPDEAVIEGLVAKNQELEAQMLKMKQDFKCFMKQQAEKVDQAVKNFADAKNIHTWEPDPDTEVENVDIDE